MRGEALDPFKSFKPFYPPDRVRGSFKTLQLKPLVQRLRISEILGFKATHRDVTEANRSCALGESTEAYTRFINQEDDGEAMRCANPRNSQGRFQRQHQRKPVRTAGLRRLELSLRALLFL